MFLFMTTRLGFNVYTNVLRDFMIIFMHTLAMMNWDSDT